jgi:hypothetical protein
MGGVSFINNQPLLQPQVKHFPAFQKTIGHVQTYGKCKDTKKKEKKPHRMSLLEKSTSKNSQI